jgi:hypothetical protein
MALPWARHFKLYEKIKLMRKIFFTLLISVVISAASQAQVRLGPFLGYGERLGLWGLGVHTEFLLNEKLSVSPVFIQYFPEELTNEPRKIAWELNGNVNYYVVTGDIGYLYGLGGFNYTQIKLRDRNAITEEVTIDPNLGLNLGLGTMFRINHVLPFAEAKYTLGGYSQFTLFFGAKFELGNNRLDDDY